MSDFAKRVNDRSLADINRANAAFHSPVNDSEDAEKGKAKPLPGFKPVSKGAERTASERANVMAGKDPKAEDKGLHELGGGQTEHSMSAAEFHEHTKGVKVTRNAGGHEVVNPHPYKTGSNTPNWRAPKGSAFHVDGDVSDVSHENGKQVIKKKGQVVVQHDEEDSTTQQREERKREKPSRTNTTVTGSKINPRAVEKLGIKKTKDERDSFPATDKTIKDVNAANQQYYNNSPHAGMAQDEKKTPEAHAKSAKYFGALVTSTLSKQSYTEPEGIKSLATKAASHGKKALGQDVKLTPAGEAKQKENRALAEKEAANSAARTKYLGSVKPHNKADRN